MGLESSGNTKRAPFGHDFPLLYGHFYRGFKGGQRNHTTQSVGLFHCKGASKIKKRGSQKQEGGSQSLYLLDITNTSKDVFFTSPWKKLKVVSHSLTSHCRGQKTKNIAQYILKMKKRTSKSRNGVKKDVIKRIMSPYYKSILLSFRHPSDHCEYVFRIFMVGNPTRLDELCRWSGVLGQQGGSHGWLQINSGQSSLPYFLKGFC